MNWRRTLALGALAVLPAMTLAGQDREPREALWRWNDSLQQVTDTAHLRQIHSTLLRHADSLRGDPHAEVRLGMTALRLAALTCEAPLTDEAARGFTGVSEDRPDWGVGWTGLAEAELAEARGGHSMGFGLAQLLGLDPQAKIVALYLRGTGRDSSQFEGIRHLARRALRTRVVLDEQVAL